MGFLQQSILTGISLFELWWYSLKKKTQKENTAGYNCIQTHTYYVNEGIQIKLNVVQQRFSHKD